MARRKGINIYIPKYFMAIKKPHTGTCFCSLGVRGTSLLTCSYIGELCNCRKFKCKNEPFIVLILILRRVLSSIFRFKLTAVGPIST